ncbi:MAG TPA: hypothetical protein VKA02_06805 [Candidatus Acidoferrum sp.]|nr:hypothetical protein [Candidatus Acidoferrum sp.]
MLSKCGHFPQEVDHPDPASFIPRELLRFLRFLKCHEILAILR